MFPICVCGRLSAVDFPQCNALFSIHRGKFNDSHVSIWMLAAHTPTLCLQSQPVLSATRSMLGCTQCSAARSPSLQAPGLGRGKSKPAWRLPSSLRSPQISLTAGLCRAKPPPAPSYPLFTQWGHRPTIEQPLPFHQGHIVREQ